MREEEPDLTYNLWGNPDVTELIDPRGKLTREEVRELLAKEIESQNTFGV